MKRVILLVLVVLVVPLRSHAWIHVAKAGETLEELANFYYGDAEKKLVIRAANGFMHPDDGRVLEGERVEIPGILYHKVLEGEDWYSLANRFLGSSQRAKFLSQMNDQDIQNPLAPGKIVKVPYQLLYIFAPRETLKGVTRQFLAKKYSPKWLKNYNLKKRKKNWGRGDAILIPLMDVVYTEVAKKQISQFEEKKEVSKENRENQVNAVAQIAEIRKLYDLGEYFRMLTICQQLLGLPDLTNPQKLGVYKYLAFGYIAFDRRELAREAFVSALEIQPSMELSALTVSPKIIAVFNDAQTIAAQRNQKKQEMQEEQGQQDQL